MILIISKTNKEPNVFNNNKKIKFLDDLCFLKKVTDDDNIIIINNITINEEGIVEEYDFFFEEIVISVNIIAIITNVVNKKILEIANFHKIPLITY